MAMMWSQATASKGKKGGGGTTNTNTHTTNPQADSLLFRKLPQEMRDQIYTELFESTRFSFGDRPVDYDKKTKIKPAPHGLALLRTCRRAHHEIGDSWLRRVTFCFEDMATMLDKLSALPYGTLPKLRRATVRGDTMLLWHPDDNRVYYRLVSALRMLPGLELDTLTVLGEPNVHIGYDTLSGLVADGNGFKTLRYISHSSELLGFSSHFADWTGQDDYRRKHQPAHWQAVLEGRDGADSRPQVTVYRAMYAGQRGAVFDPARRVEFTQKPHHEGGQDLDAERFAEDPGLMASRDEMEREMMVVVRRGEGVDYAETDESPLLEADMRRDLFGMPWCEIREACIDAHEHSLE